LSNSDQVPDPALSNARSITANHWHPSVTES